MKYLKDKNQKAVTYVVEKILRQFSKTFKKVSLLICIY